MQTSAKGGQFIAEQEGVVLRAYRDVAGVWTIGVGHTAAAGAPIPASGLIITRAEALTILARDLAGCERRVAARLPSATQTVFDGAVSFDFNTGAIDRASWVQAMVAGDSQLARLRLMQWVKAGGRTVAGLVRRRQAEARLIFDGEYDAEAPAATNAGVKELQGDLASLGFYKGAIDGVAGATMTAAISAYQKSHPDLTADGVAGPATMASVARDLAARRKATGAAGAAIAVATAGGTGSVALGATHPVMVALAAGLAVAIALGGVLALRYRDEFVRTLRPSKGA